jgi:V8-like Glu-specific endopeptidase
MIPPFTDFAGAFARDTGVDPFALPASWHAAKSKLDLTQRFNFVTDNDIIGGNSGSPMINRNGEIVGLIFDGNIHSLGGAFWFDGRNNRAVAVHSGAILETLNKVYGAFDLAREIAGQ